MYAVAYLGFHFGGVQNIFVKVGVFAWREAFVRGVRGYAPLRIFFKNGRIWCVLENILLKFGNKKL